MDENEDRKEMVQSGESDLLEDWNFVVHTNKHATGTDEAASDGESVEILSRERVDDSPLETDDAQCGNESHDSESADSDNDSNSADEDNGDVVNDTADDCNCAAADDDVPEESSQIVPVGVFPEENIIPAHPAETPTETAPVRSELELPLESRKIIVVAGLVLFIGWFLLIFHVRSEENIDKIKLDNDVKWQAMNEKYAKLMQELAIYKEKSQLMDLSLNDLKALQVDGKAVSCQFHNDEKWQQMHEKYLKLEQDLVALKEGSNSLEEMKNNMKNRMKSHKYGASGSEKIEKSDCGSGNSEKSSYCDKNGQDLPQHSEILRLIQRLDSKPDFERHPNEIDEEPEFIDLKGKFFNIKRAFETSDVKSFEEDFEKLYDILSKDKDDFIGIDLSLVLRYNSEMYESFSAMIDESEKFIHHLNESDPRTAEELDNLAHISYEYVLSNLQKSNYNIAKLVNDYQDFTKTIMIDIGYSARRYGQKHLKKEREWKSSRSKSSKFDSHDDDSKRKSRSHSKDRDESFHTNSKPNFKSMEEIYVKISDHFYRVAVMNEEIRKLLNGIPQSVKESDSYIQIVCDRIQSNLHDADTVLFTFMDSFDEFAMKVKFGNTAKKHHKKDYKEKEEYPQKVPRKETPKEHPKAHQKNYEKKFEERKDYERKSEERNNYERKDYHDEKRGKPKYSTADEEEGNMFKFIKSKINNYRKIISDKASDFNKKLKNHTMHVKEKFQKKMKSVLNFEKAKKFNEKIMHHGTKIKNKLSQKFDSLWDSVSKKLKNATDMAVASSEWLFDFGEEQEKKEFSEEKKTPDDNNNNNNLNLNNWMFKRAEFRNAKREDTAYWYFRRGNARRRNVEKYKKL